MYGCVYVLGLWSGAQDGIGGAGDGRQFWYTEYNYQSSLSPVSRYVCMYVYMYVSMYVCMNYLAQADSICMYECTHVFLM